MTAQSTPPTTARKCAAWLDCGNLDVPNSQISFRGFCPQCENIASGRSQEQVCAAFDQASDSDAVEKTDESSARRSAAYRAMCEAFA